MPERDPMVDVVIVGAGAAGSVFAAILAEAGRRVLILERGGERSLADLYSSQIWARRLKSASPHVACSMRIGGSSNRGVPGAGDAEVATDDRAAATVRAVAGGPLAGAEHPADTSSETTLHTRRMKRRYRNVACTCPGSG